MPSGVYYKTYKYKYKYMSALTRYNQNNRGLTNVYGFDHLFESLADEMFNSFWSSPKTVFERNWRPNTVKNNEDSFEFTVDLPGFTKDQVNVEVEKDAIYVSANSETRGSFSKTVYLENLDAAKVVSKLENGVLTVTAPKNKKHPDRKKVEISG